MLKTYHLVDGRLSPVAPEQAMLFIYVRPDEKEKGFLIRELGIDEHTLNSSLDEEELGRVEVGANHWATIVKRPRSYKSQDNFQFKVASTGLFLFADKLIMIVDEELFFDDRILSKMTSVRDIFLKLIHHCILHFENHLRIIRKVCDELEAIIIRAVSNKDLLNMFKVEKSLVYYEDAVNSNNKVLEKLKLNAGKLGLSEQNVAFLDDLLIEGGQCYAQIDSYSQVLSSMINARASIVNNNLNIRIRTLTILSICIMIPTLVVSLFSMNVPLPLPHSTTLLAFWEVIGLAVASVVMVLGIAFKKKL